MKLLSGTVLLLASEQAFAHAQLVQFPNHEEAAAVLKTASSFVLTHSADCDRLLCGGEGSYNTSACRLRSTLNKLS